MYADAKTIHLLGQWQSDKMLHYLHIQAQPLMQKFASKMPQGGQHLLVPAAATMPPFSTPSSETTVKLVSL
jgi:hypothetical protein